MNNTCLVGRITKDLELRSTSSGKSICEFSLAVNRIGSDSADFINCRVWEKQAENLCKYQGKGSLIALIGSIRVDKYKNEQGENRYKTYVLVNNIEYLSTKSNETKKDDFSEYDLSKDDVEVLINDDDLPF